MTIQLSRYYLLKSPSVLQWFKMPLSHTLDLRFYLHLLLDLCSARGRSVCFCAGTTASRQGPRGCRVSGWRVRPAAPPQTSASTGLAPQRELVGIFIGIAFNLLICDVLTRKRGSLCVGPLLFLCLSGVILNIGLQCRF